MDLLQPLRRYFQHESFRPNQPCIIKAILARRDVVAIMPTGSGKTLCYCLPMLISKKIGIVVSPLIALMQDQVQRLLQQGIRATFLGSHQTNSVEDRAFAGDYSIIFVTPEKLLHQYDRFVNLHRKHEIGLIAVDESHCIDRWGHDFRPAYSRLGELRTGQASAERAELACVPIAAFTATATMTTQNGIVQNLRLRKPLIVRANFDRPNLYYRVEEQTKDRQEMISCLKQQGIGESDDQGCAIIYSTTRDGCTETMSWLERHGYSTAMYHAGMSPKARDVELKRFLAGKVSCIVATEAFGMGIDKANIRAVIHDGMPKSIEAYYQQSGRAGRDGKPAVCCLFYSRQEFVLKQHHLRDVSGDRRGTVEQKLRAMFDYVGSRVKCRRQHLLSYFDSESTIAHDRCCDLCGIDETIPVDQYRFMQAEIEILRSVVTSIRKKKRYGFGITIIQSVVCGSTTAAVKRHRLHKLDCFDAAKECPHPKVWWSRAIDLALKLRCLEIDRHHALAVRNEFDFETSVLRKSSQNITLLSTLRGKGKPKKKKTKTKKTLDLTWDMCKDRLSIDAIAKKRGLKEATIAQHIAKLIQHGKPVHIETYCSESIRNAMCTVAQALKYAPNARMARVRTKLYETLCSRDPIDYNVVRIAYMEQVAKQATNATVIENPTNDA